MQPFTRQSCSSFTAGVVILLASSACSNTDADVPVGEGIVVHGDTLDISMDQQRRMQLLDVPVDSQDMYTPLSTHGVVHVPPQYAASVSAPYGGIIRKVYVLDGQHVHRGEPLVTLDNPEFITMQRDYLVAVSTLSSLELELGRQQKLAAENVNAGKVVEQTATEVRNLRIKIRALAEQLALIGISASSLSEASLSRSVTLRAPFTGYVTHVNARIGVFAQPHDVLIEIVDTDHMHIELTVYENDAKSIVMNQRLEVRLINDPVVRWGKVYLVGREINADRAFTVHGHFDTVDASLRPGTTLKAIVHTDTRRSIVVPSEAIVTWQGASWIFVQGDSKGTYVRTTIRAGTTVNGFTEILGDERWLSGRRVVNTGASTLLGAMVNQPE